MDVGGWGAVRRRDRLVIVGALVGTTTLAWVYLIKESVGMTTSSMEMVRLQSWDMADLTLTFLMWSIMMIGMMIPSAAPTTIV